MLCYEAPNLVSYFSLKTIYLDMLICLCISLSMRHSLRDHFMYYSHSMMAGTKFISQGLMIKYFLPWWFFPNHLGGSYVFLCLMV